MTLKKDQKHNSQRDQERNQMKQNKKPELNTRNVFYVRVSPSERKQILKKSKELGQSAPKLLRESYFGKSPTKVLFKQNDLIILRKDLNRIGNNLNQIARKLNSGLMEGWSNALESVADQLETLTDQFYYGYGIHKS